jgi:glutathione reductase (NADPH)
MKYDCDLFTIGAGSGGTRAARIAALAGAKVAVAEEYRIGGTCVIRGCVPKKLLVYGSEFRQLFRDAAGFGWQVGHPHFDWPTLRHNVQQEVSRLSGLYAQNLAKAGVTTLEDRAEIVDAHTVRLVRQNRTVTAERILLATGGRAVLPRGFPGAEFAITSNEAFGLDSLPRRIVIAGGGYIALEFATIFHGLGVETTLVYRGTHVLRGFDDDVRNHVQTEIQRLGIHVKTGAMFARIEQLSHGYACELTDGTHLETDLVMFAIGREPYTEGLGLERAGVSLTPEGAIKVDAYSQSSVPSIYAVGDVTNRVNLTPVAIREGHAFADTVYHAKPTAVEHDNIPHAVFCHPTVGFVGLTEASARAKLGAIDVYRTTFRPMKHILANNPERTLMKLVVDASTDRMLGVHIAGADAPEIIQLAAVAVKAGLTKAQWDSTVALHPTAAEELVLMRQKVAP